MQPLINLKSFLAVLLVLIVPAALLVAYFRNYSPEAGGHEHSEMAKHGGAAIGKDGDMSAMKPGGEGHAAMGHANMAQPSTAQSQPQQAQATPQPGAAVAAPARAPTGAGGPRSMKPMSIMGAGAEPAGMQAMGSVKDLTGSGKGTEVASRLFHAGATEFFLDHGQHLTLSTEQQKRLNQIKEQALLGNASANRKIQEAEQQLWKSTSADRPDPEEIATKVRQVEKLRADRRIGFIRAVDQAAKVLTAEQRQALLGGTDISTQPNK